VRESEPTPDEQAFFRLLSSRVDGIQDWYHEDADGTPWVTASYDYLSGDGVRATLRVDYDGESLLGGWSPSCLNWDDGVRARDAQIDTGPPDGIERSIGSYEEAAAVAAEWFLAHAGPR
jgi:hypothetical protein